MRSNTSMTGPTSITSPVSSSIARDGSFERLAQLDGAARDAPLTGERIVLALHDQHLSAANDDRSDADVGTIGVLALPVHSSMFSVRGSCPGSGVGSLFSVRTS